MINNKAVSYLRIKYILDRVFALILFLILIPIFLIISILILLDLGYPIIFAQERPGYKSKIFRIFKFRTMRNSKDTEGNLLPNHKRITKLGDWLRTSSLDELPEIINIVKGEMSFIGPRPLLVDYLKLYDLNQRKRHNVKPGITGLAQVNGRNSISWEKKFKYDLEYTQKISFILDLRIFLMTIWQVLKKNNINFSRTSTMPRFKGSQKGLKSNNLK